MFDIWFDFSQGIPFRYLILEALVFFVSLVGFYFFLGLLLQKRARAKDQLLRLKSLLERQAVLLSAQEKKIKSYKEAFSEELDQTFLRWKFTRSEREVANLLLKGLSVREIASLRKANETTVRSQCSSIYKKSNLTNRSQLSSYFFDDLL